MKTYSNRFASMEQQSNCTWFVRSEVSGLYVAVDPSVDYPQPKVFPDYGTARNCMVELYQHYRNIE